jgi:microsomal dipeptidase-like Zn-dependent dipeptidase
VSNAAADLLRHMIVWDNHACMPLRPNDEQFLPQLERCRQAGVTAVTLNVGFGDQTIAEHVRMLAHFRRWLGERPQQYRMIESVEDIAAAKRAGQLAVCFDIEGMNAVEDQLDLIRLYYELGVRWMLIAYNKANRAGGVIGINGIGIFLGTNDNSTETLVRHIDYAVQLVGADHVGIGLDYVYDSAEVDEYVQKMRATFPDGLGYESGVEMVEPERLPAVAEALMAKGYSADSLSRILGGNLIRIARQTWK